MSSYNVRNTFNGLVLQELGTVYAPFDRENMYVAFLEKFNVHSELQVYALLVCDGPLVRAWIREYDEEN